ncbi:MBL fold metallo-hydrolase [Tropicimonas sp.]|uniref:MBL fold metallo-hydrolase n=1 Tax=Tropicimonas sp. TaxID=2067044 RepID=UPI003A85DEA5
MTIKITRRAALAAAAAMPVSLAAPLPLRAQDGATKPLPMGRARGFRLGDIEVTAILAGSAPRDEPHSIFGLNVPDEEFAAVSAENFIPTDRAQFYFTPTVVRTADSTILFDTGPDAAGTTAALAEAGYAPGDITHVVITHMHGDHIGGLTTGDGQPTYASASYITGQVEYDHWATTGNAGFETQVRPLADRFTFVGDGATVAPGITSVAAFGHTPGHMAYMLDSGGARLMLIADTANHYVWSLGYPDWEVRFDNDKTMAAETRRRVLGMLAADRVPMIGYHMPFPAAGFVEPRGDGFRYVPVSYQLM